MIVVKSILVGIATCVVAPGLLLSLPFALLGWGGFFINAKPIYVPILMLFFAAGYFWEFRRATKKSA